MRLGDSRISSGDMLRLFGCATGFLLQCVARISVAVDMSD